MQREEPGQRGDQGNTTENPELPSVRKLERGIESLAEKEKPPFKVDLQN